MSESPLPKRLQMKPGYRVLVLHAPENHLERLRPLPEGVTLDQRAAGEYDVVHLFPSDEAALDARFADAAQALKPRGVLWVSYPKKSAKVKTDLTRDVGWEAVTKAGWKAVSQISVDDIWSALRFKPAAEVGRR